MENELVLKNNLKEARAKKQISQRELADPAIRSARLKQDSLIRLQNWR